MSLKTTVTAEPKLAAGATAACADILNTAPTAFEAHQRLARDLGAHLDDGAQGRVRFAFWTPELLDARVPESDVFLEILRPASEDAIDLTRACADVEMERTYLPTARYEGFTFAVASGLRSGRRDSLGDFYALAWRDADGAGGCRLLASFGGGWP